jgi:hypothetical protein
MSEQPDQSSLAELFATDPLSLTKEDRRPIIEFYISRRHLFLSGGKPNKPVKEPKPSSKGPLPNIDLDLGDLEL